MDIIELFKELKLEFTKSIQEVLDAVLTCAVTVTS